MKHLPFLCLVWILMVSLSSIAQAQVAWTPIPKSDPANQLLRLIEAAQPTPSDLPEGSTSNYIWAQNMMAWMVAERSGLMTTADCTARLSGLLKRVEGWQTDHGFYYDSYDPTTGAPTSDNVYFQGWWLWALILTKTGYPGAAGPAGTILSRLDYDAAGMVTADHRYLVADKNARTGKINYPIQPTGDIAGELRTPLICYTWLTGDITPWKVTMPQRFIDVGGRQTLSVWHHFTFDPFYVHSAFPETGYFQKSFDALVKGADTYRHQNGMRFYATRMEPLEDWNEDPAQWPNTEHRASKPWTAWLTDPKAPVMDRSWIPGYGLTQYFDNWDFAWGYGAVTTAHASVVGGASHGVFQAGLTLETLPPGLATRPPKLTKVLIHVKSDPGAGPLIVRVNGVEVGRVQPSPALSLSTPVTVVPVAPPTLTASNMIRLETVGSGVWRVGAAPNTFRPVQWLDDTHAASDVPAVGMRVFVDGQRAARENPFAFLCRAGGVFGDSPWKILAEKAPDEFGRRLVAWVGSYTTDVKYAHVIYNTATTPETVRYSLSPWETARRWAVVDYDNPGRMIPSSRSGATLTWPQPGRRTVLLKAF